jgi:hypothetical protein
MSLARRPGSAQAVHVGLEAIEDDVVRLSGGGRRAVVEVGGIDVWLRDAGEREAAVAAFAALLNGLTFPVQILVRVLPIDAEAYLERLEGEARRAPEALAAVARDHAAYFRRLSRSRALLERRFYVVVPASVRAPAGRRVRLPGLPGQGPADAAEAAGAARRELSARCAELARQLGRCGLPARRLAGVELVGLYHACWCPELARVQRLRQDLAAHTALVVRGHGGHGHLHDQEHPERQEREP